MATTRNSTKRLKRAHRNHRPDMSLKDFVRAVMADDCYRAHPEAKLWAARKGLKVKP